MPEQNDIQRSPTQVTKDPKYMGIPTFMRTPLISNLSDFDIAMIGVPYDGAVSNRPGARHGPREIRNASTMMRSIHHVTRTNPYAICRIGDAGDVPFFFFFFIAAAHHDITQFFEQFGSLRIRTLTAGGDHSITLPILRTLDLPQPVGLIHVDAHPDTWGGTMGSKLTHGTPFRRAVEEGLLDPKRTVQIGIRGSQNTTEGWDYSEEIGMRVIFMEEFVRLGVSAVIKETRERVGNRPTYLSFDIDGLDPAFAPGTGTPEIGGLTTREAQSLLRGFRGLNLVGADVVEVSPPFDPSGNTALVGATLMFEILCLLADTIAASK